MQRYLLDTNAIIYLIGGRLATPLPAGQYDQALHATSGLTVQSLQVIPLI